ncbi:hypothetical protein O3G_MSEX012833 [Manduca sexta]|uniref:Uncharacterized protein n=1 Tax=Manduca sexta TaxID=7130 RepID=A0A922CYD1_MANSE|nr:hypothetical protein O3G_MSEX012833 [Manduca sexta]
MAPRRHEAPSNNATVFQDATNLLPPWETTPPPPTPSQPLNSFISKPMSIKKKPFKKVVNPPPAIKKKTS